MNINEQKQIFAENLKRILSKQHLAQIDVSDALGVPPQTFNNWMQGNTLPRMNKLQALADYLGVGILDLVDPPSDTPRTVEALYQNYAQNGADGLLVPFSANYIYKHWKKISDAHGFGLSFHDLRHLNASIMLMLGVPEKYALERGGWSTPSVMKSVYQHTFTSERERVDARINDYFDAIISPDAE